MRGRGQKSSCIAFSAFGFRQSTQQSEYPIDQFLGLPDVFRVIQFLSQDDKSIQLVQRCASDIQEMQPILVPSPTDAFSDVGRTRYGCTSHLAGQSIHFLRWEIPGQSVHLLDQGDGLLPNDQVVMLTLQGTARIFSRLSSITHPAPQSYKQPVHHPAPPAHPAASASSRRRHQRARSRRRASW